MIAVDKAGWLVSEGDLIWILTGDGKVVSIDPATNAVTATIVVDPSIQDGGFAVTAAGAWVADFDLNLVFRVDLASGTVVARIADGPNPGGVGGDGSAIWIANHRGGSVSRSDPATNSVVATVKVGAPGPGGPHAIGLGLGSIWVSAGNAGAVVRIDPTTNAIQATIQVAASASACGGFAIGEGAVWMPSCGDAKTLTRIDPNTNTTVATIDLGGFGEDPVLVDGAPWLVVNDPTLRSARRDSSGSTRPRT